MAEKLPTVAEGDEMVLHIVVHVNEVAQKFKTAILINEALPEVIRAVGALHAIRDLLDKLSPGVLDA